MCIASILSSGLKFWEQSAAGGVYLPELCIPLLVFFCKAGLRQDGGLYTHKGLRRLLHI